MFLDGGGSAAWFRIRSSKNSVLSCRVGTVMVYISPYSSRNRDWIWRSNKTCLGNTMLTFLFWDVFLWFSALEKVKINYRKQNKNTECTEDVKKSSRFHLWVQLLVGEAAGGEEEDGREGGDAAQQAKKRGPQCWSCRVPPLLNVRDVEDAGRCSFGLAENLIKEDSFFETVLQFSQFF